MTGHMILARFGMVLSTALLIAGCASSLPSPVGGPGRDCAPALILDTEPLDGGLGGTGNEHPIVPSHC